MASRHTTRRLHLAIATALVVLGTTVPVSAFAGTTAAEDNPTVFGDSELTDDARALSPDPEAALRAYWTDERRTAATEPELPLLTEDEIRQRTEPQPIGQPGRVNPRRPPAPGPRPVPDTQLAGFGDMAAPWPYGGDEPATDLGRLFFYDTTDKKTHSCSASVVDSEGLNLVWTAGHCVHHGKGGGWHKNVVFYPHYNNGADWSFGAWYPRGGGLVTKTKWINEGNFSYDVGAVLVRPNASGVNIAQVTGGQGIAWNYPKTGFVNFFGYPAEWPFNGTNLRYCYGATWAAGADVGMKCNMTGGSSGGPWLGWFDGWTGWVNGNMSYKIVWDPTRSFSPYYGNAVGSLYNAVRWG